MTRPPVLVIPQTGNAWEGEAKIDLDKLVESRLLIQANSGGGKSHAIRYLLEQTQGRILHIVIDREGEFSTLRERFPYLLIGSNGEYAADRKEAKLLARRILELEASTIIDLSDMALPQQRDYVAVFIDALNHLPRELWKDCLVIIDEAHLFAPEKGKGESVSRESIAMLLATGRKRGFCAVVATQRLAKLDKDIAAECLNKLIGRTSSEDAKRAADELGQNKTESRDLRALLPGEFWAYGPAIATDPLLCRTGDTVTRSPKRGGGNTKGIATPQAIKSIVAALADLRKQSDEEAQTLEGLQTRLKYANGRIRELEKAQPSPAVIPEAAIRSACEKAVAMATQTMSTTFNSRLKAVERNLLQIGKHAESIAALAKTNGNVEPVAVPAIAAGTFTRKAPIVAHNPLVRAPKPANRAHGSAGTDLPKGERDVLIAIAQTDGATREQVSILAGYKRSTRDAYIQRLGTRGFVELRGNTVVATDEGIEALGSDYEPLPTGMELYEYWHDRLPEGERAVLECVHQEFPAFVSRDWISEKTGYKRSTRDAYIQRLGTRKLIETSRDGVRASEMLFDGAAL